MDAVQYANLQKEAELLAKRNAKECAQEMSGAVYGQLDSPGKVPLVEKLQKQREHLLSQVDRVDRLLSMLQEHPEFEAYQEFQDLIRRGW